MRCYETSFFSNTQSSSNEAASTQSVIEGLEVEARWEELRVCSQTDISGESYLHTNQLSILVGNKPILSKHVVHVLDYCTQTDKPNWIA